MNTTNRIAILFFLTPIIAALLYTLYYRESRSSLMNRLVDSGLVALLEGDKITRDDLRDYFQYPPVEENALLRSLELTPEDVKGIGLHEKDRELFKEQTGQILIFQVIKHLALIKYLLPKFDDSAISQLDENIVKYRESLMIEAMEADLAKITPNVTQEEMLAYYVDHPGEFYRQGKRYVRHIMLYSEEEAEGTENPTSPSNTLKPDQVWERLQNGEDFNTLISETRTESTPQDGILGWLTRGSLHQTFEKALWALDIGEITGPIPIDSTVHFIQLLDEQEEGLLPFSDSFTQIKSIIKEQKRIQNRYKLLGLDPDKLATENGEQSEDYRKALLEAAYAREWNTNFEIVCRTDAYSRYLKANWVFLDEMNRRLKKNITAHNDETTWILENKVASSLLNEMDFHLLIKLDVPRAGTLDREFQSEE